MEELKEMEEDVVKDMTPKLIGETWRKYPTDTSKQKATYGLYECQYCGKHWKCMTRNVITSHTTNCGCLLIKKLTTHGLKSNRFYNTWKHMVGRCNNPKNKSYKNYGGRGITVCEEWLDIRNFVAWAESTHPNMEGYTLDRIDNDKGYNPENCRWADRVTQALNRRMRSNNTSGFIGVTKGGNYGWICQIGTLNSSQYIGTFPTKEEAVLARDNYIVENKLPHKLSTDYKKETK